MTYLKPTTCELLHKLGVKCETGKSWGKIYGNIGSEPWCNHVIANMDERETRFTWTPAYSLPLLITDSEAMKAIWGRECYACPTRGHIKHVPNYIYMAHKLLDLLLSGDYEAVEKILVEALTNQQEGK